MTCIVLTFGAILLRIQELLHIVYCYFNIYLSSASGICSPRAIPSVIRVLGIHIPASRTLFFKPTFLATGPRGHLSTAKAGSSAVRSTSWSNRCCTGLGSHACNTLGSGRCGSVLASLRFLRRQIVCRQGSRVLAGRPTGNLEGSWQLGSPVLGLRSAWCE